MSLKAEFQLNLSMKKVCYYAQSNGDAATGGPVSTGIGRLRGVQYRTSVFSSLRM